MDPQPTQPQTPPETPPQQTPQPVQQTPPQQPQQDTSAQYWQSEHDKAQHQNQQLQQRLTQLEQKVQQFQPPPQQTPQPQQTQTQDSGLNFMDINAWRAEDGGMKPEYAESVFGKDVPKEVRNELWSTVNQAQQIVQQHAQQQVSSVFGNQESYQQAAQKAAESLPQMERDALNAALSNPVLMPDALAKLKSMADERGWLSPEQAQQQLNEPPNLPTGNPQTNQPMSPLVPGSPEAIDATNDPRYKTDANYRKRTDERLRMGDASSAGSWGIGM